jgi:hypothetical protein
MSLVMLGVLWPSTVETYSGGCPCPSGRPRPGWKGRMPSIVRLSLAKEDAFIKVVVRLWSLRMPRSSASCSGQCHSTPRVSNRYDISTSRISSNSSALSPAYSRRMPVISIT